MSSTKQDFFSAGERTFPTAADVGETCLKLVAATMPVASLISFTSCHELNASRKLIYPGLPFKISTGSSLPSAIKMRAGFWLGLQPYFKENSFIGL